MTTSAIPSNEALTESGVQAPGTESRTPTALSRAQSGQQRADSASDVAVEFWTRTISNALDNSASWLVEAGHHLTQAKQALGHGRRLRLFEPGGIRFGIRTAEMLMKVADHFSLQKPQHLAHLPRAFTTLYELAHADARLIERGIADGTINPQMTAKQAREFVQLCRGREKPTKPRAEFDEVKAVARLTRCVLREAGKWAPKNRARVADALAALSRQIRDGAASSG